MNIIDYVNKNKDKTFKDLPFNEVDNLILSCISYLDFKKSVPSFDEGEITLHDALKKLNKKLDFKSISPKYFDKFFQCLKDSKRFGNTILYNFIKVNKDMQFQAITMRLNDNSVFVSFAGTDTSILGWKEDFNMAYLFPGKSQKFASVYLNKTINILDKHVRVGGHSKGGNLAICAVMNANWWVKYKVKEIYNNDGPGFLKEQVESSKYKKIENKIKMYVPKQSIIGMILYHIKNYKIVKAKSFSIFQHNPFYWECDNERFITTNQSHRSKIVEQKLTEKLEDMTIDQKLGFVDSLFKIFDNLNISDTKDIKITDLFKLVKKYHELDKETQNLIVEFFLIAFIK